MAGVRVWVAWCVEDPNVVGVAVAADVAMAEAETDNGGTLVWIEKSDGRFTAGDRDYPSYQVQPFEVTA